MVESIKELRIICQKSRENEFYYKGWVERNLYRRVSIYFTKLFLKLGISANQTTIMGFLTVVIAGVLFILGKPWYWIIGALLIYLFDVLDRVDGEIARYHKSASTRGEYLDGVVYFLGWPFVLACMSFGLYNSLQHISVFILGFLALVSFLLFYALQWLEYRILHERGLLAQAIRNTGTEKPEGKGSTIINLGRTAFSFYASWITILTVSLVDYFLSPAAGGYILFTGSLVVNARYLYFALYGIGMLVAVITRIVYTIRVGVKLRLI